MNFLNALEKLENIEPANAVSQLYQFLRYIAEMDSHDLITSYQALHFFWQEVKANATPEMLQRLRRIRLALVSRMVVLHVGGHDGIAAGYAFAALPGLSYEAVSSRSSAGIEENWEEW